MANTPSYIDIDGMRVPVVVMELPFPKSEPPPLRSRIVVDPDELRRAGPGFEVRMPGMDLDEPE